MTTTTTRLHAAVMLFKTGPKIVIEYRGAFGWRTKTFFGATAEESAQKFWVEQQLKGTEPKRLAS